MILKTLCLAAMMLTTAGANAGEEREPSPRAGWHKRYSTELQGANVEAAKDYLKAHGLKPGRQVVVGIIDSGIDTTTVSLRQALWDNPGETAGDGQDNDGNGYVDDLHGWNFLGTADGRFNMTSAGTEEYRQFKRLYPKYKHTSSRDSVADPQEYDFYLDMRRKAGIDRYLSFYQQAAARRDSLDSLSLRRLAEMERNIRSIEGEQDKRLLMGDDMDNANDIHYGNATLTVDGCEHGTFVGGVIAGHTPDDPHFDGIAQGVARLMIVRASPEGDEYDKDVATAIRYAVDNGAQVINISLGKYYSPRPDMVNDAIRYALERDVVVVHAAGNNGKDLDSTAIYPTGLDAEGHFYQNFLRVGASDAGGRRASFSNYGRHSVHLFAPGTEIASVFPGNDYALSQGTSLAAPVVTAVAALLRSYFPEMTAAQVCQLLVATARPMASQHRQASMAGGTADMLAAVRRKLAPADWQQVEASSEKSVAEAVGKLSISPSWVEGGPCLTYRHGGEYYLVNAQTGKTEPLLKGGNADFARQLAALTGDTLKADDLRFFNITMRKGDTRRFYWKMKKHRLVYDRQRGRLDFDTTPEQKEKPGRRLSFTSTAHTADSAFTMLGDRHNLYVRDNLTGQTRQLTTDGRDYSSYCYHSAKDTLAEGNPSGFWKGHVYFDMIYDDTQVGYLNIVHSMETPPRLEQKKMPLPGGEAIRRYRLYWYNADTGEGRLLPVTTERDQFVQLDYDKQADHLYFLRRSRSVDTLQLCRIEPQTGRVSVVISEECKPHANVNLFNYHLIDHGRRIIWWSERTGRGNYYLYDGEGRLLNRITRGDQLVCGRIERIDTLRQTFIFQGYGQQPDTDPNYTYYYKVDFGGRRQQLLSHGDGQHDLQLSPDGLWAVDRYSRMDMPWVYNVVSLQNPANHHEFFRVSEQDCLERGWKKPVLVKVKAADGQTDLYGVMFLPSQLDTNRKYPIISNVYPGPQDDQIQRSFAVDDNGNQSLAEVGFVVINVQPRGSSPLRGRDFYCHGYGNLRDYPVADDRHTIETLASEYPFIDLSRVGIYGHSGGGFETVAAMLGEPDFYKVGVAASGNHDNSVYIQWWAETYHGLGKPIPTNMELADRLKGRLLLVTGEVDENVPVASTIRMADALIRAGKRFDMMVLPEQGHGLTGDYYQNLIRYYFLEHLMTPEDVDIDIVNHK